MDDLNLRDIHLSGKQLDLIGRIRSGKTASKTVATASSEVLHDYEPNTTTHILLPNQTQT
jgi:hypothetical protein